jgi:hypothetical protein
VTARKKERPDSRVEAPPYASGPDGPQRGWASIENKNGGLARTYGLSSGYGFDSPTLIIGKLQEPLIKPGTYLIAIGVPTLVSFPITVP